MENKPVYKKETALSPSPAIAIMCYVIIQFIAGAIFIYLVAWIYSMSSGMDFKAIIEAVTKASGEFSEAEIEARGIVNGWGNLLVYLSSTALVVFYMRDMLKDDFTDLVKKPRFMSWYIPVTILGFLILTMSVDMVVGQFVPESANQSLILDILSSSGAVPMIISVVLLAPVVEELIYRKAIFHYTNKKGLWLSYLVSMVLFAIPHMLSTTGDFSTWLIQCIPYLASAGFLAMIYHLSGFNIYTTIACHMANNLLAVIMAFIQMSA